ncbi:MAG TPA: methyl-accepting chemotaxis protein [Xenococcaceae cyanobacterium]|jgi:twitching motility protein PilJ
MNQEKFSENSQKNELLKAKGIFWQLRNPTFRSQLLYTLIPAIAIPLAVTTFLGYQFASRKNHRENFQQIQIIDVNSNQTISNIGNNIDGTDSVIIDAQKVIQLSKILLSVNQEADPNSAEIQNLIPNDLKLKDFKIEELDNNPGQKNLAFSFLYNNRQYRLATIPETSFVVASSIAQTETQGINNNLLASFLILITILFIVIITTILIVARQISNPIQELVIKAETIASGNLDVLVNPKGTTETKSLGKSFNRMIETVKQSLKQQTLALQEAEQARQQAENLAQEQSRKNTAIQQELLELLEDVEGASRGDLTVRSQINDGEIGIVADFFNSIVESLRDIISQVKQTANLVNESIDNNKSAITELVTESDQQAQQIDRTLFSVEAMTSSIQEVAHNAQEAAKVANIASIKAETGGKSMERTASSIMQLQATIDETANKVKRLGEASQQISRVISLINQIAMQTNLLAINASIEAARAGAEGKGFAVVAEEVGQLATQSSAATKEVGTIVATIQQEIAQVVEVMEIGTNQAQEGTRLVEETKTSLQQIVAVSYQIDRLIQSISNNTVSQAQTSETVTQLMQQIAQLSKQTSTASLNVTDSLETTIAIAKKLQSSVDTFKV